MMEPHWYFVYIFFCAECGHEERVRERREGKRPGTFSSVPTLSFVRQHCGCVSGRFA